MAAEDEQRHKVRVDVRGGAFKVPGDARPPSNIPGSLSISSMDEKTEETLSSPLGLTSGASETTTMRSANFCQ